MGIFAHNFARNSNLTFFIFPLIKHVFNALTRREISCLRRDHFLLEDTENGISTGEFAKSLTNNFTKYMSLRP